MKKKQDSIREHWEHIYHTKDFNEVSWYQENPKSSVNLILSTNINKDANIIDVGGGDSRLVDNLLELNFRYISVLDISLKALEKAQQRLGEKAKIVKWINSDLREFETNDMYDLWHDRAVLHFLTVEEDINKYVSIIRRFLKPNGYLIVATFSDNGPKRCSGLDIKQYSEDSMKKLFSNFEHIKSFEEEHITPLGSNQNFLYSVFRNRVDKK